MKNHNYIIGIIFLLLMWISKGYSQIDSCTLIIEITQIRSNNGLIALQLYDNNQKLITGVIERISHKKCLIIINNLNKADYAIRYFHDENSNDKLDTNWLGLPTEGYGFSNNATATFGVPDFEEWIFKLDSDIRIKLKPNYCLFI